MGKHRAIPQRSLQARTVIGGAVMSGALLVGAPAGMALARTHDTGTTGDNSTGPKVAVVKPSAQAPVPAINDENRDIITVLTAVQTKAATDPGFAKLLTAAQQIPAVQNVFGQIQACLPNCK